MAATATNTFLNLGVEAMFPGEAKWIDVAIAGSATLARGTILGEVNLSDIYTVTTGAQTTGSTFTLTFGGGTTTALDALVTAAQMQAALRLLPAINGPNVNVSLAGTPGTNGIYTVTFIGTLANKVNSPLTANFAALTTPANASLAHPTIGVTGGTYKAYASGNTDGSAVPKGILQYDVVTDAGGNITFGLQSGGGPYQQTSIVCPMFTKGDFACSDLVGLDANAVTVMGVRLLEGTITNGIIRLP